MIIEARCHLRYRRVISAIRCFYCESGEYRLVLMASLSLCPNHLLHAALVMGDAPLGFPVRGPACLVLDTRFSDLATIEGGRTLHFAGKCPRRTHRGSDTQRACPLSEHPSRQQLNAESERSPHGDAPLWCSLRARYVQAPSRRVCPVAANRWFLSTRPRACRSAFAPFSLMAYREHRGRCTIGLSSAGPRLPRPRHSV